MARLKKMVVQYWPDKTKEGDYYEVVHESQEGGVRHSLSSIMERIETALKEKTNG